MRSAKLVIRRSKNSLMAVAIAASCGCTGSLDSYSAGGDASSGADATLDSLAEQTTDGFHPETGTDAMQEAKADVHVLETGIDVTSDQLVPEADAHQPEAAPDADAAQEADASEPLDVFQDPDAAQEPDVSEEPDAAQEPDAPQEPEAAVCTCKNPNDLCSSQNCVRDNYVCSPIALCDQAYTCSGNQCICNDARVCGQTCSTHADCGSYQCHPTEKVCVVPRCFFDDVCDPGEVCVSSQFGNSTCVSPGSKALGQACNSNEECQTALCLQNVCLQPCVQNADCGSSSLYCVGDWNGTSRCQLTAVCQNCTGADQICQNGVCGQTCTKNSDCAGVPGQVCLSQSMMPGGSAVPECQAYPASCAPNEFLLENGPVGGLCTRGKTCWWDTDCDPGWTCDPWMYVCVH